MKIHTVRAPFLCRAGQFEENKRSLCIGLDYNTLKETSEFWCYIGKNTKTHYEIGRTKALTMGRTWKNSKGKTVIIVPLSFFKAITIK
jgi:orotidine-5'-phosphate decarboxylase